MLQAYADDSKKHLGRRALFLAGFINTAEKWVSFSNAWAECLSANPAIRYFKSAEAEHLRGEFGGWGKLDRDIKLRALAEVIASSEPWSLHVSLGLKDFERTFDKHIPHGFRNPYWMCFHAFIVSLLRLHNSRGVTTPVELICDEQSNIERSVRTLWEHIVASQPRAYRRLITGFPTFRSDREIVALQAADMLVWHVQHETRDGELGARRAVSSVLFQNGNHAYIDIDKSSLEQIAAGMRRIPGADSIQSKKAWREVLDGIDALGVRWVRRE